MKKLIVVCFLLFCLMPLSIKAQEFYVRGYIAENDKAIQLKDSMALWNAKKKELKVYFYPFKLAPKDLTEYPGFIAFDKPSPDKALWDWCPYGALSIDFEEPFKDRKLESINHINYILYGFTKKNHTMNINRNDQKARDSLETFVITNNNGQEILTMSTKGEYTSFSSESKYSWDIKVCAKVISK